MCYCVVQSNVSFVHVTANVLRLIPLCCQYFPEDPWKKKAVRWKFLILPSSPSAQLVCWHHQAFFSLVSASTQRFLNIFRKIKTIYHGVKNKFHRKLTEKLKVLKMFLRKWNIFSVESMCDLNHRKDHCQNIFEVYFFCIHRKFNLDFAISLLLDEVFVISRIIEVEVGVISRRLITLTETSIILDITKI